MDKSKEAYIGHTGKMFPPHIVISGYFLLVFIPLTLFDIIKIDLSLWFVIIGLFLSIIFAFSTSGIIINFQKAVYKFYFGILFFKFGKWQSVSKINKILLTEGKIGWAADYGKHFKIGLASKSYVVYFKTDREKKLVYSGNFENARNVALKIATSLNLPIYTDRQIENEENVQIITLNN